MLGNLSKILIKAPNFFNNSSLNPIKEFGKYNKRSNSNLFNQNKIIHSQKCDFRNIYFRERDFWLNNYEPDINFNHNRRSPFSLKNYPLKKLVSKNIQIINPESKTNFNTITNTKKKYCLTDKRVSKNDKSDNLNIYNKLNMNTIDPQNNDFINEIRLKTESNQIINRRRFNLNIDNEKITNMIADKIKKNENGKRSNNKHICISEFPDIYKSLKSQENLFQDRLDKKFNSLKLIKPEIKEQLKTKKRSMVGRQDYLKFQKQFNSGFQNPFYESMKIKEELDFIK